MSFSELKRSFLPEKTPSSQHLKIHVARRSVYGVLQGPNGPCCSAAGPESQPTEESWAFHLLQTGRFSEAIKSPNICSRLCHQPSTPPVSLIKLSTACSSPLCSIHLIGKSPPPPQPRPQAHRTVCLPLRQKRN